MRFNPKEIIKNSLGFASLKMIAKNWKIRILVPLAILGIILWQVQIFSFIWQDLKKFSQFLNEELGVVKKEKPAAETTEAIGAFDVRYILETKTLTAETDPDGKPWAGRISVGKDKENLVPFIFMPYEKEHFAVLSSAKPSEVYFYRAEGRDEAGKQYEAEGSVVIPEAEQASPTEMPSNEKSEKESNELRALQKKNLETAKQINNDLQALLERSKGGTK